MTVVKNDFKKKYSGYVLFSCNGFGKGYKTPKNGCRRRDNKEFIPKSKKEIIDIGSSSGKAMGLRKII